jgi:hypothetical protein
LLLLGMRMVAAGVLVVLLCGPSVVERGATEPARGRLELLIDVSASMGRDDVSPSRAGRAIERWLDPGVLSALGATHDVTVSVFDERRRAADPGAMRARGGSAATGDQTMLTRALSEAVRSVAAPAGGEAADDEADGGGVVMVVSDGRESSEASPLSVAASARRAGVVVHAAAAGTAEATADVAVTATVEPTYLLVGEPGRVRVKVVRGGAGVERATVRLRGGAEEVVRTVAFGGRRLAAIDLPIEQAAAGTYAYTVSVDPVAGEIELRNNHQPLFVDVLAGRFDVLLLEGEPTWDTRYIARALRRDERVALTQITRLSADRVERLTTRVEAEGEAEAEDEAVDGEAAFASDDLRWEGYDVVILGGAMDRLLTPALIDTLPAYVGEQGGRVIFAHGRPYDPDTPVGRHIARAWRAIEPVRYADGDGLTDAPAVRIRPRAATFEHPAFAFSLNPAAVDAVLDTLPAVPAVAPADALAPATEVLATATPTDALPTAAPGPAGSPDGPPAMVTMPYARGVVTAILADGLWRWAMLDADRQAAAGAWDRFWSNTVRWLALGGAFRPGQDVTLRLSSRAVELSEPVYIDLVQRSLDAQPDLHLEVEDPDGRVTPLPTRGLGGRLRQRATLTPDRPGVYRVRAVADGRSVADAMLSVYQADRERLDTAADPALLEAIAQATGGRLIDLDRPRDLVDLLDHQRAARLVPPRPEYVWDRAWVMVLLLSWLGLEWIGRRLAGMI